MSNLRVREYPRTINKRRDKIILRGEVKNARGDLTVSEDYSHLGLLSEVSGELISHLK